LGMPDHMAYATPRTAKTRQYPSPAGLAVWFAGLTVNEGYSSGGSNAAALQPVADCCTSGGGAARQPC
jgi:hypothetical protein